MLRLTSANQLVPTNNLLRDSVGYGLPVTKTQRIGHSNIGNGYWCQEFKRWGGGLILVTKGWNLGWGPKSVPLWEVGGVDRSHAAG